MIRATCGLLLLAILGACASPAPVFRPVQDVAEGFGVVYVYRMAKVSNRGVQPGVTVDGREYPAIPSGRYLPFVLKEGEHEFGLVLGKDFAGSALLKVEVAKGAASYVHVTTYNEDMGAGAKKRVFRLDTAEATWAVREINQCTLADPKTGKSYILVDD